MPPTKSGLKKSVARRWVRALLSGKYAQYKGGLRAVYNSKATSYCCLGVLCDVSRLGTWRHYAYEVGGTINTTYLPDDLLAWAKLTSMEQEELARLNDQGHSFRYIARRICKMAGIEMPVVKKKAPAKAVRK